MIDKNGREVCEICDSATSSDKAVLMVEHVLGFLQNAHKVIHEGSKPDCENVQTDLSVLTLKAKAANLIKPVTRLLSSLHSPESRPSEETLAFFEIPEEFDEVEFTGENKKFLEEIGREFGVPEEFLHCVEVKEVPGKSGRHAVLVWDRLMDTIDKE